MYVPLSKADTRSFAVFRPSLGETRLRYSDAVQFTHSLGETRDRMLGYLASILPALKSRKASKKPCSSLPFMTLLKLPT